MKKGVHLHGVEQLFIVLVSLVFADENVELIDKL